MSHEICKPVKLFSFCVEKKKDGENKYIFGEELLPVFHTRPTIVESPFNLASGVNNFLNDQNLVFKLNHWDVLANMYKNVGLSLHHITDHSNVVCYREFLKDLILLSFGKYIKYTSVAIMYNGIVFIEKVENLTESPDKQNIEKCYMEKKFKTYFTSQSDNNVTKPNLKFDFYKEYYVTKTREFKVSDSTIKVMYTGEVDSIYADSKSNDNHFLRMKLATKHLMQIINGRGLYKTWAEAFMADSEFVVAGVEKKSILVARKFLDVSVLETKLPFPVSKIMEFVGGCLKSIIDACKKCPNKYIIIPQNSLTLQVADKNILKSLDFVRPTSDFLQAFPYYSQK